MYKETCICVKETYIRVKDTCIRVKETCILVKETYIHVQRDLHMRHTTEITATRNKPTQEDLCHSKET